MTTTTNNEQKKLNVPNLRFPEFQGKWNMCKLGDIAIVVGGGTPDTNTSQYWNGKIQWFTPSEIGRNKYVDNSVRTISEEGLNKSSAKLLPIGTILLSSRATVGECSINKKECTTNQGFQSLIPKENISNEFVYYLIQTKRKDLIRKSCGSTFLEISANEVRKIVVSIPTIKEQDKIANVLSLLDERIATQNKIIEDLKKLKCAIIEKLYAEVKGTKYSYRQLFNVINERNKQLEYSNVLSASQEKGMVSREDLNLDTQFERSNISTYKIVKNGDYVIHLRSFQGGFAFSEKTGICSPAYTVLRPNNSLVYGYLSNYFTSRDFVKSLMIVTYGIRDGRSINVEEWFDMKVVIPSKEQQIHIVNVIESIENKIKNEEKYSNCLLNQKQYLLRQMFI